MTMTEEEEIPTKKVVFLGEAGVGKTAIIARMTEEIYSGEYESTIGADFQTLLMEVNEKKVKLEVWDTAGQERYHSLISSYIRAADVVILVVDISSHLSFERLSYWRAFCNKELGEETSYIIASNKKDLENSRQCKNNEVVDYARANQFYHYQVSAKTGDGIKELFESAAIIALQSKDQPAEMTVKPITHNSTLKKRCCRN